MEVENPAQKEHASLSLLFCHAVDGDGNCAFQLMGKKCRFVHNDQEFQERKLKAAEFRIKREREIRGVCRKFQLGEVCPFGDKCKFAHRTGESAEVLIKKIENRKQKKIEKIERAKNSAKKFSEGDLSDDEDNAASPGFNISLFANEGEFKNWIGNKIRDCSLYSSYKDLFDRAIDIIVGWQDRYRSRPDIWSRFTKGNCHRLIKELCESAPVIDKVLTNVSNMHLGLKKGGLSQVTVLDLCSGFGFLSMFLSELLPPERVNRILLIDKMWSRHAYSRGDAEIDGILPQTESVADDQAIPSLAADDVALQQEETTGTNVTTDEKQKATKQYINADHITGEFYRQWPIPMTPSHQDIKSRASLRSMQRVVVDRAAVNGPLIILGIHLCGILSLRALDIFNSNLKHTQLFVLKPCCLPALLHSKRQEVFQVGRHSFPAADVCAAGKWVAKSKGAWTGPPRNHLEKRFYCWCDNLLCGIDTCIDTCADISVLCTKEVNTEERERVAIDEEGGAASSTEGGAASSAVGVDEEGGAASSAATVTERTESRRERRNRMKALTSFGSRLPAEDNVDFLSECHCNCHCGCENKGICSAADADSESVLSCSCYWHTAMRTLPLQQVGFQNRYMWSELCHPHHHQPIVA